MTLKLAIEEAIYAAAPDVMEIVAEGVTETAGGDWLCSDRSRELGREVGLHLRVAKAMALLDGRKSVDSQRWERAQCNLLEVRGRSVLFCRLGESFYAYDNNCPGCGSALKDAHLELTNLVCRSAGNNTM